MKIRILNRRAIEKLAESPFPNKTAVVSITSFHNPPVELKNPPAYLLPLSFDDLDAEAVRDEVGHPPSEEERLAVEKEHHVFSEMQAHKVAEFYFSVKEKVKLFICQCEFGQSRSAGIAAAILEFRKHSGIRVFADDRYYPNKLVFRRVLQALKTERTRRQT